jgi:cbb3-type cytochrome oxidase maturation protein
MEALYLLIPLSLILVAFAVWIFFGAAESGQFEDLDGPALRILHDDDPSATSTAHAPYASPSQSAPDKQYKSAP